MQLPTGFVKLSEVVSPMRMIMSLVGPGGGGKGRLALQAPAAPRNGKSGVLYINLDRPIEEDLLALSRHREIYLKNYYSHFKDVIEQDNPVKKKNVAEDLLKELRNDHVWGVDNCRSIVRDTGTALWDLINLATLGKVPDFGPVDPSLRTRMNATMKSFYTAIYESDNTLIETHEIADEWVGGKPTGRLKRKGYGGTEHLTQVEVWLRKERCICNRMHDGACLAPTYNAAGDKQSTCSCKAPCGQDGQFHGVITLCKPNPDMEGIELLGKEISFATVATLVFPDSDEKDWE